MSSPFWHHQKMYSMHRRGQCAVLKNSWPLGLSPKQSEQDHLIKKWVERAKRDKKWVERAKRDKHKTKRERDIIDSTKYDLQENKITAAKWTT